MKYQDDATILSNHRLQGDYFQVDLSCTRIPGQVEPGQFVHVQFPDFSHRLLRRPFSVYNVDPEAQCLSIIYKVVGEGTSHLSKLPADTTVNLMGPLGNGFTLPELDTTPIIVAGGYGGAATYLLARRSPHACAVLVGGRTAEDLLLVDEFKALGSTVQVATDDGSRGHHGVVTDLLEDVLDAGPRQPRIFSCGPMGMLRRVSEIVLNRGLDAEISLDHVMCCGVGACFACVVKMKADTQSGWEYVRTCKDGPVFRASRAYWD